MVLNFVARSRKMFLGVSIRKVYQLFSDDTYTCERIHLPLFVLRYRSAHSLYNFNWQMFSAVSINKQIQSISIWLNRTEIQNTERSRDLWN